MKQYSAMIFAQFSSPQTTI